MKRNKNYIKVLPLPYYYKWQEKPLFRWQDKKEWLMSLGSSIPSEMYLNRDGLFYNRKTKQIWIEYKGEGYFLKNYMDYTLCFGIDFDRLSFLNNMPRYNVIQALIILETENYISKEQKKLLYAYRQEIALKKMRQDSALRAIRFKKETGMSLTRPKKPLPLP